MAAAFTALRDDGGGAQTGHQLGHGDRGDHGDHFDARVQPHLHMLGRIARARRHHRHLFLGGHLGDLVHKGTHEHDVHAEGTRGQRTGDADLLPHVVSGGVARGDDAQAAALGHGGGQLAVRDPGHAALKDRVLDAQQIANCCFDHLTDSSCFR